MVSASVQYKKLEDLTEQELLAPLKSLEALQVSKKPAPDSWSLLEVAQHLLLVEKRVLKSAMEENRDYPQLGILDDLRIAGFGLLLLTPIKVKVPVPEVLPQEDIDRESLLEQWQITRQGWHSLLDKNNSSEQASRTAILKHPIAGWMNLNHCLSFMHRHFQHHIPQIRRILAGLDL